VGRDDLRLSSLLLSGMGAQLLYAAPSHPVCIIAVLALAREADAGVGRDDIRPVSPLLVGINAQPWYAAQSHSVCIMSGDQQTRASVTRHRRRMLEMT
jgi:hypothetical protein